jgi:hypothetical protein
MKLKASLDQASAGAEQAEAQRLLAQQNYDRQSELFSKQVVARATLDTYTRNLESSTQALAGARAEEERSRLAYSSNMVALTPRSLVCVPNWTIKIPVGAAAQVAVYTEHWHHLSLLRKILLRMKSWENFIFTEGH